MIGYEVAPPQVRACAAITADVAERARTQIAQLGGEVEALLAAGWTGPAAAGFACGWHRWHDAASDLVRQLQQMADLLARTGHGYATAESANTSAVTASGGLG